MNISVHGDPSFFSCLFAVGLGFVKFPISRFFKATFVSSCSAWAAARASFCTRVVLARLWCIEF